MWGLMQAASADDPTLATRRGPGLCAVIRGRLQSSGSCWDPAPGGGLGVAQPAGKLSCSQDRKASCTA